MRIYTQGNFKIEGKVHIIDIEEPVCFKVPQMDKSEVTVELFQQEGGALATSTVEISTDLFALLESRRFDWSELNTELKDEISVIKAELFQATARVLILCRYYLNWFDLNESLLSIKSYSWSIERETWRRFPTQISVDFSSRSLIPIRHSSMKMIQQCLTLNHEPFIALQHLLRAEAEMNPRYKWIDATIAAELAIKEFLIRFNPELQVLLLEMPSPPLDKLYGTILEQYIGERSPKLKAIREGATIRNKLMHRPQAIEITKADAREYVKNIRAAIYHLLKKLYPDMKFLEIMPMWEEGRP